MAITYVIQLPYGAILPCRERPLCPCVPVREVNDEEAALVPLSHIVGRYANVWLVRVTETVG